jgi:hypothetical protein
VCVEGSGVDVNLLECHHYSLIQMGHAHCGFRLGTANSIKHGRLGQHSRSPTDKFSLKSVDQSKSGHKHGDNLESYINNRVQCLKNQLEPCLDLCLSGGLRLAESGGSPYNSCQ